jgi:hypothetical protein
VLRVVPRVTCVLPTFIVFHHIDAPINSAIVELGLEVGVFLRCIESGGA